MVNRTHIHAHPLLEVRTCEADDGPGTKLLCALSRFLELCSSAPATSALVLADDDREYKPTALTLLASALQRAPLFAYSFMRYTLPDSGGLNVGQGADLFALPFATLRAPHTVRAYFEAALSVDDRFRYHDDVWISAYLADAAATSVCHVPTIDIPAANGDHEQKKKPAASAAPPQFLGPVHGPRETWSTALRRLGAGNETRGVPRKALNKLLGAKRAMLRVQAGRRGVRMANASERVLCEEDEDRAAALAAALNPTSAHDALQNRQPPTTPHQSETSQSDRQPAMQQRRTPTPEQEHLGEHLYAHTIVRPAADRAFGIDVKDAEARWARDACPFEETRHNCFFFGQPNAGEVARRALGMLGTTNRTSRSSSSTASLLAALRGRRIHFVGDSVLRQLCQAVMCRLRSYLVHDGTNWWDPMKRRHPALDYKGMCPYAQARHCEMRYGCATFAARTSSSTSTGGQRKGGTSGGAQQEVGAHESTHERPLTICYVKEERLGWEGLIGALRKVTPAVPSGETRTIGARGKDAHRSIRGTAPHSPDVLVVSSGRHHSPIESLHAALWRQWGGTNDSSVATQRANFHSAFREALLARERAQLPPLQLLFQQAEPQHFPTADGGFDSSSRGKSIGLRQCTPLQTLGAGVGLLERQLVLPYLSAMGAQVLETNALSEGAWWAHTYSAPTPSGNSDCTHYCMPGVPDVWASLLLGQLAARPLHG